MKPRRRVAVAGLFHETHTFVDAPTAREAFEFRLAEEMLGCAGDASPLGGALELARELGWEIVPLLDARAVPSGTVADAVWEEYWREFRGRAAAWSEEALDGVLLILHGAMVTTSLLDVEGELLRRIRDELGWRNVPVAAVLDLHANVTPLMAQHASALIAYRENPHTDARETGRRAVRCLDDAMASSGQRLITSWRGTSIVWPPAGTGTAGAPMAVLEEMARAFERDVAGVCAVNVCAGFSFADTPETGVSFSVVHREAAGGTGILDALAAGAWELREAGNVRGRVVDEVLAELPTLPPGLVVLAEESDNIGGGAPGDGTGLLRALLAHGVENAAICLADAGAVRRLRGVASGETMTLPLGGRGSRFDAGPLTLEVTVERHSDGRFALEDRQSHLASVAGDAFDMGPTVLVGHRGVRILLTTHRTPPMDLGQWKCVGVDPAKLRVIGVKAAVAHRRAYDPIAVANFLVDTPGPCRGDLRRLDFQHIRRPVFPLDESGQFANSKPCPP